MEFIKNLHDEHMDNQMGFRERLQAAIELTLILERKLLAFGEILEAQESVELAA